MPLVTKDIVPVGTFFVNSPEGKKKVNFTEAMLQTMAKSANGMISAKMKIPMPFGHRKDAVPIDMNMQTNLTPDKNNGYWDGYYVQPNEDNIPTLYGFSNLEGSSEDKDSPYYKAKHQCKEVSVSFMEEYEDGNGRKWPYGIIHTALVNNPVVSGQQGFQDVLPGALVLSMSTMDVDDISNQTTLLTKLRSMLKESVNLVLSESCTMSTLVRDLLTAAEQIKALKPDNAQDLNPLPVFPISMSNLGAEMKFTYEQAKPIVEGKVVNPSTNAPYTYADFGVTEPSKAPMDLSALQAQLADKDKQLAQLSGVTKALLAQTANNITSNITQRINNLVASKRVTQDYATTQLVPKVAFSLSVLEDSSVAPHPLELTLSTLEAIPAPKTPPQAQSYGGGMVLNQPFTDTSAPLEGDVLKDILAQIENAGE
jgi:hypothetical protein